MKLSPAFYGSRNTLYTEFTAKAFKKISLNKLVTLLDAGGFDGRLAVLSNESLTSKGFNVSTVVLDLSLDGLIHGKQLHKNLDFVRGDIFHLPFKDDSFDLVCSYSVFEHLPNPQTAAKDLATVSKGSCIIQIPNMHYFIEPHTKTPFLYLFPNFARKKIGQITGVPYFLNFNVRPASLTVYFHQAAFRLIDYSEVYHAKWTKLLRSPQGYLMHFEYTKLGKNN